MAIFNLGVRAVLTTVTLFVLGVFTAAADPIEHVSSGSSRVQRSGMHACPSRADGAWLVVGVHVGDNKLLCAGPFAPAASETLSDPDRSGRIIGRNQGQFSYGEHVVQMHICPPGSFVTGVHEGNNQFLCSTLAGGQAVSGHRFLDPPEPRIGNVTQRQGMHACPFGSVLVGAHFGLNIFACQLIVGR